LLGRRLKSMSQTDVLRRQHQGLSSISNPDRQTLKGRIWRLSALRATMRTATSAYRSPETCAGRTVLQINTVGESGFRLPSLLAAAGDTVNNDLGPDADSVADHVQWHHLLTKPNASRPALRIATASALLELTGPRQRWQQLQGRRQARPVSLLCLTPQAAPDQQPALASAERCERSTESPPKLTSGAADGPTKGPIAQATRHSAKYGIKRAGLDPASASPRLKRWLHPRGSRHKTFGGGTSGDLPIKPRSLQGARRINNPGLLVSAAEPGLQGRPRQHAFCTTCRAATCSSRGLPREIPDISNRPSCDAVGTQEMATKTPAKTLLRPEQPG